MFGIFEIYSLVADAKTKNQKEKKKMKRNTKTKIFRKVLILTFLVVGLIIIGADRSICVSAAPCDEAFVDYLNADNVYYIARLSYFIGSPTTCQQECQNSQDPNCVNNCQIHRHTALAEAEIDLFSMALDTCTPLTVDECAQAQGMAEQCLVQYNYMDYTDPDEALAVYSQY